MYKKAIMISIGAIGIIIISATLFLSWLSLGGCPPSYWISTEVIPETTFPTTNITRNDLPSDSILRNILIDMIENTSLTSIHEKVSFSVWNMTKSMLTASNIIPTEEFSSMWTGYIFFEDILILVELLVMVC